MKSISRGTVAKVLLILIPGCHSLTRPPAAPVGELAAPTSTINTTKVDKSPTETAKLCFATAQELDKAGKDAQAAGLYEKARQADRRLTIPVARRLAVVLDRQGQFDKARAEYDLILAKHPNDADTLNNLGYAYYSRGQWELAETHLRKALAADPKHKRARVNLGMTLAQRQDYQQSLDAFAQVVPLAQGHCNLAFILTTQGKFAEAKASYREALRLDPGLRLAQAALTKLENSPAPATVGAAATTTTPPALLGAGLPTPPAALAQSATEAARTIVEPAEAPAARTPNDPAVAPRP